MTTNEYKETDALLRRFFEGETTMAEEERLYLFFSRKDDLPEEWKPYRPVLEYFREGISRESAHTQRLSLPRRKRWTAWTAAAIALVLLAAAGHLYLRRETPFDPYEGSYIIQNGVRITDMELIRPELDAATQRIKEKQEEMEQLLASAEETEQEMERTLEKLNRILQME
jgi:hypothetical protein